MQTVTTGDGAGTVEVETGAEAGAGAGAGLGCVPKRSGRRRDESRDPEILHAALDVLAETGYERMTMDAVAARAKAGKATMYRRWPSKAQLVVEAVACTYMHAVVSTTLPDTGSLRGDLIALTAKGPVDEDGRKLRIMAGLISAVPDHPDLAAVVDEQLIAPRSARIRRLLERAEARGEITPGLDLDFLAQIAPAMTAYRVLLMNKPTDPDFYTSLVDEVLIPLVRRPAAPDLSRAAAAPRP